MVCKQCGYDFEIQEKLFFCPKCGTELNEANNTENSLIGKSSKEVVLNSSSMKPETVIDGKSMKWFNFMVRYAIPIWVFFGAISEFNGINSLAEKNYLSNDRLRIFASFDFFFMMVLIIFLIISRIRLKSYTHSGYILILSILLSISIYRFLLIFIVPDLFSYEVLVGQAIAYAIFCLCNIIYFYKRRNIFH